MSGFDYQITFRPASEKPTKADARPICPALLFNTCDGYHTVFARFDDDGEFDGFYDWMGVEPWTERQFSAWALLPDVLDVRFDFKMD